MAFFNFGKKKEAKTPACACNCGCPTSQADVNEIAKDCCCAANKDGKTSIKVLGAGCDSCHILLENTKQAVKNLGLDVEVEYVTDMKKIVGYGVMSIPALVVNEKVITAGKVLNTNDVKDLLQKLGL